MASVTTNKSVPYCESAGKTFYLLIFTAVLLTNMLNLNDESMVILMAVFQLDFCNL